MTATFGPRLLGRIKHLPLRALVLSLLVLVLLIGSGIWTIIRLNTPSDNGPSPLLFGTNLGLFNGNDQVLRSEPTRVLLQQMHVRIIRMPIRSELSEDVEIHAAQIIKDLGAIPLVILHSVSSSHALADDTRIIQNMNRIFGQSIVYYEFGNEDDWTGVDVTTYTNAWNSIVPQLKPVALHGQFIGPVNYQYDGNYLEAFLRQANPQPDEVSWHEYTCPSKWAADTCITNIDKWSIHIKDSRNRMQAAIGSELPIMISEWNYSPDAAYNDGKSNNAAFMTTWTTKALQTLINNHIFAAMQYSCTNTVIPLIDNDNKVTSQGTIFRSLYVQTILHGNEPPPTPTPTLTLNGTPRFSFEDGSTNGWNTHSQGIVTVQNTTTRALDGHHAIQVTLSSIRSSDFPYISVNLANMPSSPHAGQTVTAYVYLPASNAATITAKIFVVDSNYHWLSDANLQLVPGTWNRLTYTLPATLNGLPDQLGIQFNNPSSTPFSSEVYIDAIGWQ